MNEPHLTPDEVERVASGAGGFSHPHLAACARCRAEVDEWRALDRALTALPRIDVPVSFASDVMRRVDLPAPWLDRLLALLPPVQMPAGFADRVMARVRLPVPWPQRALAFVRGQRVAVAASIAALVTVTGAAAGWLFGLQGMSVTDAGRWVVSAIGGLAVDGLLAAGRLAYRFGLVDGGSGFVEGLNAGQALGALALASTLGLMAIWTMAKLNRPGTAWVRAHGQPG